MKVIITTEQYGRFVNLVTEQGELDLNKLIDYSKVSSLEDLKTAVATTGLQHRPETKTRSLGIEITKILSGIEKFEDKEIFEKYFTKVSELISMYKKGSFSLKKLGEIVQDLNNKDINVARKQVEDIISIFEDPRFSEKHKKKLINLLTGNDKVDLDKFYDETKKLYQEYENSFAEGPLSPFDIFRTSPTIKVIMVKDYSYNNVLFSASEFNSKESDLSKVLYIIDKLKEVKFYGDVNETIRRILSSLYFGFNFNYSDDNVKADLKLKESLTYEDRTTKKLSIVGSKGDLVEVKYKKYNDDGYLSEFFKVDSTDKNVSLMIENMSQIPKVINLRETFDVFMSSLVNNLLKTIKGGDGEKIIDHLTKDLTGIIFKNDILVPKENIAFYWNNVGYANRSRLSIWYKVSENPTLYKISKINEGYTRFIQKI